MFVYEPERCNNSDDGKKGRDNPADLASKDKINFNVEITETVHGELDIRAVCWTRIFQAWSMTHLERPNCRSGIETVHPELHA